MATGEQRKPNVVVFFTDQQRWDTSGLHGNPLDLTPNFDRMAVNGTHFEHAYTCQPVCGPARASFQTGLYSTETTCFRNGLALPETMKTLAHHFRDGGYRTGYIGKWHLAGQDENGKGYVGAVPEERRGGYEYWLASNILEFTSRPYDTIMYDNDNKPVKLPGYRVDAVTDAAIRYIDNHKHEPFFLFVSTIEPHQQNNLDDFPPPDGYRERYANRWVPPDLAALGGSTQQHLGGYYGMVKRIDEAFGRLLDTLKSLDLDDNTIVFFTSDHGCHFKTRNGEYKRSCHDSSLRIPAAITGPGFDGRGRVRKLVSLVDFTPTLLNAAALPVPGEMQGRSMMPLVRGDTEDWPDEIFAQVSESQVARVVRTRRWKYSVSAPGKNGVEFSASDNYLEEFLFDTKADPYELNNLIGIEAYGEVTERMRQRLLKRMVEAGEKEPTIDHAPLIKSGQRKLSPGASEE